MTKLYIFICIVTCVHLQLHAQSNIVATGGDADGAGGSVSHTAGQIDFSTKTGTGGIITEGVQQPFEITVITGIKEIGIDLKAEVFPNPAKNFIELQVEQTSPESMSWALADQTGRILNRDAISDTITKIPLSLLPGGLYFLQVVRQGKTVKTFRISVIQ